MISHFLKLEWKQFFRTSHWQKGIALKIIMQVAYTKLMQVILAIYDLILLPYVSLKSCAL